MSSCMSSFNAVMCARISSKKVAQRDDEEILPMVLVLSREALITRFSEGLSRLHTRSVLLKHFVVTRYCHMGYLFLTGAVISNINWRKKLNNRNN